MWLIFQEDVHLWNWEADFLDVVEQKQDGINTLYYYAFRRLEQSLCERFFKLCKSD